MRKRRWMGWAMLGVVQGCAQAKDPETPASDGASFGEGMRRLCEVDARAGLDPDDDPITIESARYDWALANVEHPDVIELVTLMRVKSESERAEMLREACSLAKLSTCPLADTLEDS